MTCETNKLGKIVETTNHWERLEKNPDVRNTLTFTNCNVQLTYQIQFYKKEITKLKKKQPTHIEIFKQ